MHGIYPDYKAYRQDPIKSRTMDKYNLALITLTIIMYIGINF